MNISKCSPNQKSNCLLFVLAQTMWVIDGIHRVHAAVMQGDEEIAGKIYRGTEHDAFVIAVRINIAHGLPLSRMVGLLRQPRSSALTHNGQTG